MRIAALLLFVFWQAQGQNLQALLDEVAAYEHGRSRAALVDLERLVAGSLGTPEKRSHMESALVRLLGSNATLAGKDVACRHLSVVGGKAAVPALARILASQETADMARYALERIPDAEAGAALRNALAGSTGKVRIGIVNSLGRRKDEAAVPAIAKLILPSEPLLASASLAALGEIGGPKAMRAVAAARKPLAGDLRRQASEAYLRCAASLPANERARAAGVYRELAGKGEAEMVRVAALAALAQAVPAESLPLLRAALNEGGQVQAAAISALAALDGAEPAQMLAAAFPGAQTAAKVRIVTALAGRKDAANFARLFMEAAQSATPPVRAAGLAALGPAGGPDAVDLLARAAARAPTEAEQNAARESLYRLRGAEVDQAVLKALGAAADPKAKIELIKAASERGVAAASNALFAAARDDERDVRREAIRALRDTADGAQVPQMLALLAAAKNAADRVEIGRSTAYVVKRSDAAAAAAVLRAYESEKDPAMRVALVQILGQTGLPAALPELRNGLKDPDRQIARAAILALSDWPTPEPLADLAAVAKDSADAAQKVLALRGYIRLVNLPANRTPKESAALLSAAMALATQAEEKRAVLASLPRYACQDALAIAESALKDEAVQKEARLAVENLRRALAPEDRQ